MARQFGYEKLIWYLLAREADRNNLTDDDSSPIEIAHNQGHRNIVKLLHIAGAIVSDRLSAVTGFQTKVKKAVLAIGDETDVRETCAHEDCGKVETAYGQYSACAACKLVYDCSKECQVSAWRSNKKQCKRDVAARVASEAHRHHHHHHHHLHHHHHCQDEEQRHRSERRGHPSDQKCNGSRFYTTTPLRPAMCR